MSHTHLDRYIKTGAAGSTGNGGGVDNDEAGDDEWEEKEGGQESRAPADGARLPAGAAAASVEPYSGTGGSSQLKASASAWEPRQTAGEESGHEEDRPRSSVWGRLGKRVVPTTTTTNNGHSGGGGGGGGSGFDAQSRYNSSSAPVEQLVDERDDAQQWADWAQSMGSVPGSPSDAAAKWAAAIRIAAGAAATGATPAPGVNGNVGAVPASDRAELAFVTGLETPRHAEGIVAAAPGGGSVGWTSSRGGRVGGRGGRSNTWVRDGLRGDGTEGRGGRAGVARGGGRVVRGGRRGRGFAAKSLGRSGGWHSTGSVAAGGRGGGGAASAGAMRPAAAVAGVQRETWNKVWVRKDLRTAGDAAPPQHYPDDV